MVDALGRIGVHSPDQRPPLGKRLAQQRLGLREVALAAQQVAQPIHGGGHLGVTVAMQRTLLREGRAQQRFGSLQRAKVHVDAAQDAAELRLDLRLRRQRRIDLRGAAIQKRPSGHVGILLRRRERVGHVEHAHQILFNRSRPVGLGLGAGTERSLANDAAGDQREQHRRGGHAAAVTAGELAHAIGDGVGSR